MKNCVVIGGGPSGMMAAGTAALQAAVHVNLLEKNEKLGKKLYLTGKGRCNITNACPNEIFFSKINANPRFMYSSLNAFDSRALISFFEKQGLALKTERGGRVFPVSDRSSDVIKALTHFLRENNVTIQINTKAQSIEVKDGAVKGVRTEKGFYPADAVIIATGGLSYPSTGSTGDGYAMALMLGHTVEPTYPSLVPIRAREGWAGTLEGLSLKHVRCAVKLENKKLYEESGEMLFTHNGVSGPLILSASRYITNILPMNPLISIDLKPALDPAALDGRLIKDFTLYANKNFANALDALLPKRLIGIIVELSGIRPDKKARDITRAERARLGKLLKHIIITPVETAGYNEAVITAGGVKVNEINPSTLMSKIVKGLFFAGEVLDVDAMTGGYNLQIAFSTGFLAGRSAVEYMRR